MNRGVLCGRFAAPEKPLLVTLFTVNMHHFALFLLVILADVNDAVPVLSVLLVELPRLPWLLVHVPVTDAPCWAVPALSLMVTVTLHEPGVPG